MKPAGTRGAPAAEAEAAAAAGGGGKAAGLAPISAAASRPAGEKVVHSRSQGLFCSGGGGGGGTQALGDALKLLVPRSTAFMSSEAELWDFLCSLRHEFSPVILRSKDVYGYASCRAVVPDLPGAWAQEDEEEEEGRAGSSSSRSSRRGGGGGGGTAANNKGKAKSRRGGGGGGRSSSAKRAAKKQRSSHDWRKPMLWACEKRREPAGWTPSQGSSPEPLPDPMPPILAAFPPPVKVRGDIWKRRTLEAARRRAQRLLRVDLAPVVRLRRIPLGPTCR